MRFKLKLLHPSFFLKCKIINQAVKIIMPFNTPQENGCNTWSCADHSLITISRKSLVHDPQ